MQHCKRDAKNIGFYTKNMISGSLGAPWGVLGGPWGALGGSDLKGILSDPFLASKGPSRALLGAAGGVPFSCLFVVFLLTV